MKKFDSIKKFNVNKIPTHVSFSTPEQEKKKKAVALAGGVFAVWVVWKLLFLSAAVFALAASQYKHNKGFREDVDKFKDKVTDKSQDAVEVVKEKTENVKEKVEDKVEEVKDKASATAKDAADSAKDAADDVKAKANEVKRDVRR